MILKLNRNVTNSTDNNSLAKTLTFLSQFGIHCKWISAISLALLDSLCTRVYTLLQSVSYSTSRLHTLALVGNWQLLHTRTLPGRPPWFAPEPHRRLCTPMQHTYTLAGKQSGSNSSVNGLRKMRQKIRRTLFFEPFLGVEIPRPTTRHTACTLSDPPELLSHRVTIAEFLLRAFYDRVRFTRLFSPSSSYGLTPAKPVKSLLGRSVTSNTTVWTVLVKKMHTPNYATERCCERQVSCEWRQWHSDSEPADDWRATGSEHADYFAIYKARFECT